MRTGGKWKVQVAIQQEEEMLRHKSLVRVVTQSQAGQGYCPTTNTNTTKGKEKRGLNQETGAAVEEGRVCKAV